VGGEFYMIRKGLVRAAAGISLAACSAAAAQAADPGVGIAPREAIVAAADAAPRGVSGEFALVVRATGRERGRVYLNSERDYRDQRNLTVNIDRRAAEALERRYGAPAHLFFENKAIRVRGVVRRVRIDFLWQGRPTGKYYYQTHVLVADPDQIAVTGS
jgi:hypothetical protein